MSVTATPEIGTLHASPLHMFAPSAPDQFDASSASCSRLLHSTHENTLWSMYDARKCWRACLDGAGRAGRRIHDVWAAVSTLVDSHYNKERESSKQRTRMY